MLNVKFSNSELDKLKPGIKIVTEVTLNILSNLMESSNDEVLFEINYYYLIHRLQKFVKILQMVHKLIYYSQKLSCLR